MTEISKIGKETITTYEEPCEYSFTQGKVVKTNLSWNEFWISKHKAGNRLPRGKKFDDHRHLEHRSSLYNLGKLLIGSIKAALIYEFQDSPADNFNL